MDDREESLRKEEGSGGERGRYVGVSEGRGGGGRGRIVEEEEEVMV